MRWGGPVVLIVLLVATAVAAPVVALRTLERAHDRVRAAEAARTSAQHVSLLAGAARTAAMATVLGDEPGEGAAYRAEVEAARHAFEQLRRAIGTGSASAALEDAIATFEAWIREGPDVVVGMAEAGNREGAAALWRTGRSTELYQAFVGSLGALQGALAREVRERQSAERRSELGALLLFGLGAIAAAGLVAGAAWALAHLRRARRAARESEALAQAAHRLAEERRELLGAATNELRGPLTALVLAADMLSDEVGERGDQALAPLAREVARSVRRLTSLIEDFLDYIALESGTMTLVRERVDLCTVVEEAVGEVRLAWRDATPVIESRTADADVWADAPRLRRGLSAVLGRMYRRGQRPARIVVADEGTSLTCTFEAREAAENRADVPSVAFEVARRVVALHGGELLDEGEGGFLLRLPKLGSGTSVGEGA